MTKKKKKKRKLFNSRNIKKTAKLGFNLYRIYKKVK